MLKSWNNWIRWNAQKAYLPIEMADARQSGVGSYTRNQKKLQVIGNQY